MNGILHQMDDLGLRNIPFLFIIDFDMKMPVVIPLKDIDDNEILFSVNGIKNHKKTPETGKKLTFKVNPVDKQRYCRAFEKAQYHINRGDSFLLNLTMPTKIVTNHTLKEIFYRSNAPYKLWVKDKFTLFSPEIFVKTENGVITSFPMKGTMDATIKDAEKKLLENRKELAEHYTIVDLIRNDLSTVARNVTVKRFRYIQKIKTHKKELLQMSSEISGQIRGNYENRFGSMFEKLLPAGSVSGAPKKKTVEIIKDAEQYNRGYYTGVFGIFDGKNIDSAVMIRFIEKTENGLVYKSGGGITALSNCSEEYNELIDKVYVPFT
jgi:para-aminobenzoate synthetase component 1